MISLNKCVINKKCKILKITADETISKRFSDMGLIKGATIEKVLISPFGSISAYSIIGTTIAIRDNDVKGVIVEYE